jgi:hypothetical protein
VYNRSCNIISYYHKYNKALLASDDSIYCMPLSIIVIENAFGFTVIIVRLFIKDIIYVQLLLARLAMVLDLISMLERSWHI